MPGPDYRLHGDGRPRRPHFSAVGGTSQAPLPLPVVTTVGATQNPRSTATTLVGSVNAGGVTGTWSTPVNLVANPSFEYDGLVTAPAGWTPNGPLTVTVSNTWASSGNRSLQATGTLNTGQGETLYGSVFVGVGSSLGTSPVVPGNNYAAAVDVLFSQGPSAGVTLSIVFYDSAGTVVGTFPSTVALAGPLPSTLTVSAAAPLSASSATVVVTIGNATANGTATTLFVDKVVLVAGTSATYVDGDVLGYGWSGTAGQSTSAPANTWAWFKYGTAPDNLNQVTPISYLPGGSTPNTLTQAISLTANVTYYYAAVAQDGAGQSSGTVLSVAVAAAGIGVLGVNASTARVSIPHFSLPFSINNLGASVVDQESLEEVASCVMAVVLCPLGACPELGTFGIEQPTFSQAPPSTGELLQAVQQWEPRATVAPSVTPGDDGQSWNIVLETASNAAAMT